MAEAEINLEALRRLDPQVISAVHDQYFPQIYRYARYRLPDNKTAEDITGEVFVRLLEAMDRGKGPVTSLRGWLFGTASNLVNDYYRAGHRSVIVDLPDGLADRTLDPRSHVEQRERMRRLEEAAAALTPDQQHVLALRFGSGLSVADTAAVMDKRENAVKALQFRALRALRREMGVQG